MIWAAFCEAKNRLFALRYCSSASLASLSPVDCYAGATILAAKKMQTPSLTGENCHEKS